MNYKPHNYQSYCIQRIVQDPAVAKLNIELDLNKKDEPEKSENAEEVEEDKPSVIKQIKDIKAKSEQPPGPKPNVPPEKKEEQEI